MLRVALTAAWQQVLTAVDWAEVQATGPAHLWIGTGAPVAEDWGIELSGETASERGLALPALTGKTLWAKAKDAKPCYMSIASGTRPGGTAPMPVYEPDSAAVSGTASSAAVIFTADMKDYESISLQVLATGSPVGTISYETSDNNVDWVATAGVLSVNNGSVQAVTTSTGTGVNYHFPRRGRYFRARVSAYTSGTYNLVGHLSKSIGPIIPATINVSINGGPAAHDAVISGAPLRIGARAVGANYAAVASGDAADIITTLVGVQVQKPFSIPEADWQYAGVTGGITDTAAAPLRTAGAAGIRNYLTGLQYINTAAVASEIVIRDGAGGTVLWRGMAPASMIRSEQVQFATPIKGTAATLMEVAMITTGTATRVSAQGYQAP